MKWITYKYHSNAVSIQCRRIGKFDILFIQLFINFFEIVDTHILFDHGF
jgi:hypothetical protein